MNTNRRAVGIAIAFFLLVAATTSGSVSINLGGWWHAAWPLTSVLALLGVVGLTIELTRKKKGGES